MTEIGRMSKTLPVVLSALRGKWEQSDKGQSCDLCIFSFLRQMTEDFLLKS